MVLGSTRASHLAVRGLAFAVLFVLMGSLSFSTASAQRGGPDLRIGVGAVLDFAGELDADYPGTGRCLGAYCDDDLKLTPGLRVHLDYDVHRYISVGGLLRTSWWEGDDYYEDRNFLFDLAFRLGGHYDWRNFRFYLALAIGPMLSAMNDDGLDEFDNPGVGVHAGLTPGFEWWFSSRAALFLEMFGWSGHYFSHEFEAGSRDVDFALNQVTWQLGIVLAP